MIAAQRRGLIAAQRIALRYPAMFADLAVDTAARADSHTPGRYHTLLPHHWDFLLPSGGVVMTCALRAAAAELADPALRFASATTIFCTPIKHGPLVSDVVVLRRGGSAAQVRVALHDASGEPGLEVLATFLRERKGPDVRGVPLPRVRSLADALSVDNASRSSPHVLLRFHQQLEYRIADGARFGHDGEAAGPPRYARWVRYRTPQRDAHGRLDRLALMPLIDMMPAALHRAIGPGSYRFHAPSLDLTTYVIDDTSREWLLCAITSRRARAGWAISDVDVWDDEGRYLAHGAQAMFIRGVAGEPPVIDASGR
ncbi:MAG: thioesterase family protein [Deltaproteobacteria bacterium]|nr:MAG: thioesterase family protein [Deltaproteobacteria bacterium]